MLRVESALNGLSVAMERKLATCSSSSAFSGRRSDRCSPLLIPEGLVPEGRGELEFRLQPMVKRPSYRFAFLFPDEIGADRDFIFSCFRTSVGHVHFLVP